MTVAIVAEHPPTRARVGSTRKSPSLGTLAAYVLGRRARIGGTMWLLFGLAPALVLGSQRTVTKPVLILAAWIAGVTLPHVAR